MAQMKLKPFYLIGFLLIVSGFLAYQFSIGALQSGPTAKPGQIAVQNNLGLSDQEARDVRAEVNEAIIRFKRPTDTDEVKVEPRAVDASFSDGSASTLSRPNNNGQVMQISKSEQQRSKGCAYYLKLGTLNIYLTGEQRLISNRDIDGKAVPAVYYFDGVSMRSRCFALGDDPKEIGKTSFFPSNTFPEYKQERQPDGSYLAIRISASANGEQYFLNIFDRYMELLKKKGGKITDLPIENGFHVYHYTPSISLHFAVDPERVVMKGYPITFYCTGFGSTCHTDYLYKDVFFRVNINKTKFVPIKEWLHFYDLFAQYVRGIVIDDTAPLEPQILRIEEMGSH